MLGFGGSKRPKKKTKEFVCHQVQGERFHAQVDDVFRYNWWEVFCFPYILLSRVWECCVSLCAGTNQCLIYWMMIQWLVCKISRITTPDPIIFPYYFYVFCQVFILTSICVYVWVTLGRTVIIPYFVVLFESVTNDTVPQPTPKKKKGGGGESTPAGFRAFRRYCFRKGEIFDTSIDDIKNEGVLSYLPSYSMDIITLVIDVLVYEFVR